MVRETGIKSNDNHADNCAEFLSYSESDRVTAGLEILTNATPTEAMTLVVMLGAACRGEMPEFSKAEANKDAAAFLPYFRNNCHIKECEIKAP